jgi:hypothetical protein
MNSNTYYRCAKSPVMTIRNHIAKSLISIVSIERYTTFISDIFNHHFNAQYLQHKDNNYINGLLEILNNLVEKHRNFIRLDVILAKLDNYCHIEQLV